MRYLMRRTRSALHLRALILVNPRGLLRRDAFQALRGAAQRWQRLGKHGRRLDGLALGQKIRSLDAVVESKVQ